MNLSYSKFKSSSNISRFTCGDTIDHKKLDRFLKERAIDHQKDMIGTTIIVHDADLGSQAIGYMTIMADGIAVEEEHKEGFLRNVFMKNIKYSSYPAIKIGRLAVDKRYQKKGVGRYLFNLAVAIATNINSQVGIRFIVLDSKEMSKEWYIKKLEFKQLAENDPYFLYYDLKGWNS